MTDNSEDGFSIREYPRAATLVTHLLCLLAGIQPAEAKRRIAALRGHCQEEARSAAQAARRRLSPDPVKIAFAGCNAAGGILSARREHRVVYLVNSLISEVGNGGWLQWVANSCGAYANETLDALREIGADRCADELRKVMDALGPDSSSHEQRRRMASIDRMGSNERLPPDGTVWRLSTDIEALVYDYAERHPDAFATFRT